MSSNLNFFNSVLKLFKSILPVTLVISIGLTLTLAAGDAVGGKSRLKTNDTKLGEYLAGRHALFINDADSAVKFFRSNMLSNPNNLDIQSQLFTILIYQGKVKESLTLAEKLVKEKIENINLPLLVLALRDFRGGKYSKAIQKLDKLPANGIDSFSVPMLKAWALAAEKRYKKASKILKEKMKNPGFIALYAPHAGLIAELAGKPKDGLILLKEALKQYRRISANLTRIVGEHYERNGMNLKAKALYSDFIETNPDSYIFNQALKRLTANSYKIPNKVSPLQGVSESLFSLSRSLQRQDPYQAILWTRLAIFVDPEFSFAKLRLADALTREDNLQQALVIYKNISKDAKYDWVSRLRVARTYNFLDKTDEAARILETMAKEDRNVITPLVNLGSIYRSQERYRDAVNAYQRAKKRVKNWNKSHWQLLFGKGASHERLKEWPAAETEFLKALELNPKEPTILNYLGYSWLEQGKNIAKAYKMISVAVKQRPQAAYIVDSLGWAQYHLGDLSGAVKSLERAVLLDPADATINDHLGDVYWKVGRKLEAKYQWKKSLSLGPEKNQVSVIEKKIKQGLPQI